MHGVRNSYQERTPKLNSATSTPFTVQTPEDLSAAEAVELFVEMPETKTLSDRKHTFVHGPRGSGKSMNFRWLMPDVQMLKKGKGSRLADLPFFAAHFGVKVTGLGQLEMTKMRGDARLVILGEHQLVIYLLAAFIQSFAKSSTLMTMPPQEEQECVEFFKKKYINILNQGDTEFSQDRFSTAANLQDVLHEAISWLDEMASKVRRHFARQSLQPQVALPWNEPIFDYSNTLEAVTTEFRKLGCACKGPVYFFVDDADYLSTEQTSVLNSFISRRRFENICFKVGTQLSYKHYVSIDGRRIETPHDFTEIRLDIPQTGDRKKRYIDLLSSVIQKRLHSFGIKVLPADFFPEDQKQTERIREIAKDLKEKHKDDAREYRAGDMAYRLARPEYMRLLGGMSKQSHQYSYSGFDQLAHISSGVIRNFLEPASKMYNEQIRLCPEFELPSSINPSIQNAIIREESDEFKGNLLAGFRANLQILFAESEREYQVQIATKLERLVECIGAAFHAQLMNKSKSERRVFSFALSDYPSKSLKETLELGIREGVLLHHYIGKKDGFGKTDLYILSRRLAPTFKLDPNGFSGYLFFCSDVLERAIQDPAGFSNDLRRRGLDLENMEVKQLALEFGGEQE